LQGGSILASDKILNDEVQFLEFRLGAQPVLAGTVGAPQDRHERKEGTTMASGKSDELKGRVKEAAGALTGDEKLKREGKVDQVVGKIKQKVEKVVDKVKDAIG
jgi:uncharacterized protein YjbJ (UPF0337 family)